MTTPSKPKSKDNSFSAFSLGVTVGVAASLLFGTEEGRSLVKKCLNSIPDKYKQVPEPVQKIISDVSPQQHFTEVPIIPQQETSHHATYPYREAPPRPAPYVRPSRPDPLNLK